MASHFVFKKFTVDDATWTPIVCPIGCDSVKAYSLGLKDADVRTDAADSSTEELLLAGSPVSAESSAHSEKHKPLGSPVRFATLFSEGDIVCYVRCRNGLDTFLGKFLGRRSL